MEAVDEVSLLFENAPDAILLIDVDHNTLINVNENACHLTGHAREALIGAAPDLLRPPGAAGLPEQALATEWSRHLASGEPPRFDWAYRTSSGEVVPCEVHLSQLVNTGRNMLRVSIIDISARRQAELVLRLSEEKFSRVFHGSPDYITITRLADGTLFDANEGFERVSGWSPEEAIGRTSLELGIWRDPAERDEMRRIIERDGSIHDFEFTLARKDGQTRICLLSASTITVSNEQLLVAIIRDISDIEVSPAAARNHERGARAAGRRAHHRLNQHQRAVAAYAGHARARPGRTGAQRKAHLAGRDGRRRRPRTQHPARQQRDGRQHLRRQDPPLCHATGGGEYQAQYPRQLCQPMPPRPPTCCRKTCTWPPT